MTEINTEPQVPGTQEPADAPAVKDKRIKGSGRSLLLVVLLLVIVLLGAAFWYQQQQFQETRQQLTRQLEQSASVARQADDKARQALAESQQQQAQVRKLQSAIDNADAHLQSLEQALQIATDSGTDLMLLNDIDRLVVIAQQQLQLSSNVSNAIIALESAQSQLARANRPSFASLQQALNGDLDRLRGVSNVDFALRTSQLDKLYALISDSPLQVTSLLGSGKADSQADAAEVKTDSAPASQDAEPSSWWETSLDAAQRWSLDAWDSVKHDLHSLVEVRRVDDQAALLLSPEQTDRLRDSMRSRVVTARLALLMRQPDVWQAELSMLEKQLSTRFDGESAQVREALSLVKSLAETPVEAKLPTLENITRAIESQRELLASSSGNGAAAGNGGPAPVANAAKDAEDKKDIEFPNMVGHQPEANNASSNQSNNTQQGANGSAPDTQAPADAEPEVQAQPSQQQEPKQETAEQVLSSGLNGTDLHQNQLTGAMPGSAEG